MITIAFDEQGSFENTNHTSLNFIAGLLYDDRGSEQNTEDERKRIYRYYNAVCDKAQVPYPSALHVSNETDNRDQVALTKTIVGRTLGNFLKDGVFLDPEDPDTPADYLNMDQRKGKYHLFVKVRSEKGRSDLLGANVTSLIKDSYASNLYVHMAQEIFDELLIDNPFIEKIDQVYIDLPTRMADGSSKKNQYELLDYQEYSKINPNVSDNLFQIANPDVYRTSLDQQLRNANSDIKIKDFRVTSITYHHNHNNCMSFLHMADSICSLIGYNPSSNKPSVWVNDVKRQFEELTGHTYNFVFAYDDADVCWQKAYRRYKENNLLEALNSIYDGMKTGTSMVPFYSKVWYKTAENKIAQCNQLPVLKDAAEKLQAATYTNSIEQERLLYCYEILHEALKPFENNKEASEALFALYDAGAAAYNHTGQPQKAMECRKKSKAVSKGRDISQTLRMRNRLTVSYCDALNFEEALKTANDTIGYEQMIRDMQAEMIEGEEFKSSAEGIALSQRGQVYAFMRKPEAESDFINALDLLNGSTDDYYITLSYLLHYYLDVQNKEKYEEYAKIYFKSDDLYEQFTNLINEGCGKNRRINLKFSLYIFVKAVWEFYRDSVNKQMKKALLDIESALVSRNKEAKGEISGHPWEIIYKYLAFYAYSAGNQSKANDYIQKSQSILINAGEIIEKINSETLREYERLINGAQIIDPESPLRYMYR